MLTDEIAALIEQMLNECEGTLELRRNEMAGRLGCVPSQISYVISSRFTPERGYVIESRKGGGGCIRIVRKAMDKNTYLMHFFAALGDRIDEREAIACLCNLVGYGAITERDYRVTRAAISDAALVSLPPSVRSNIRADILRQILLSFMNSQ